MTICMIFGSLICIWAICQTFFRPYTFDELLALDHISPEEEAKSLDYFSKRAKSKEDLYQLQEYIYRYCSEKSTPNSFQQFHHLLWLAYRFGTEDDLDLAVLVSEACLYGLSFVEIMFPEPSFKKGGQ